MVAVLNPGEGAQGTAAAPHPEAASKLNFNFNISNKFC